MDKTPLERLDSFPYRHRVAEVMRSPVATTDAGMTLEAAARRMVEEKVSSLISLDESGCATGIITERDILRALAEDGPGAATDRIEAFITSPVHDVREDAFVYKALGRMMARKVRHLVVVEPVSRRATGIVTGRALLKLRVGDTLQLGDRLDAAQNAADMAAARAELPGLVRRMLAEGVGAMNAASVISQVYCDMTRRPPIRTTLSSMRAGLPMIPGSKSWAGAPPTSWMPPAFPIARAR
jgi:signal-transduction protein with cAMP-binding, CBS, and nucleotidyltransferase domain